MSDFDKEAERERLREKYERDQKKREATEKMSELLLKGATMTNGHCENCGDPIFRYDGQEFCPTCEEVITDADAQGESGQEAADAADASAESAGEASGADAAGEGTEESPAEATNGTGAAAEQGGSDADETPDHIEIKRPSGASGNTQAGADGGAAASQTGGEASPQSTSEQPTQQSAPQRSAPPAGGTAGTGAPAPSGNADGDLAAARESLVRTLVSQARQAENCDDPRRASDHLAAAREAAEALSALSY